MASNTAEYDREYRARNKAKRQEQWRAYSQRRKAEDPSWRKEYQKDYQRGYKIDSFTPQSNGARS